MGDCDWGRHPMPPPLSCDQVARDAALQPAELGELGFIHLHVAVFGLRKTSIISDEGNGQGCVA